jgi:hypothetical protein
VSGLTWCGDCLAEAATCHACGHVLGEKHYRIERRPEHKFCESCVERADCCDFCQQPVPDGGYTYSDGRISCDECRATAVVAVAIVSQLEAQARQWIGERLGWNLPGGGECPVHLVDSNRIAEIQGKAFDATPGFDVRERGLFSALTTRRFSGSRVQEDHTFNIYLELGLPRNDAFGTTVHELVHLWQFGHFPRPVHRKYLEGLACWGQYHALLDHGHTAAAESVARRRDPIYGGGFQVVKQLEEEIGFEAVPRELVQRLGGR